jgi:hypothetical protein
MTAKKLNEKQRKIYHTVGTVAKSNQQIVKTDKKLAMLILFYVPK